MTMIYSKSYVETYPFSTTLFMLYHLDGDAKLSLLSMVSNNYGTEHCQLGFYTQLDCDSYN